MTTQPILAVNQLQISDSHHSFFSNITFTLAEGEVLAVMGPSGIGKSMLSKAVAGFLPKDVYAHGEVFINGKEVSAQAMLQRESAQRPAVIFQDALQALNPLASVEQQLSLALTNNKTRLNAAQRTTVTALLEQLGFNDAEMALKQYPSQLSGGQRQRVCIAIALLGQANLLIADEPTSALDPITEAEILTLFRDSIQQRNIGGMLITHDLSAALACDKLLVIAEGTMVAYGSPKEAITSSDHEFCQQLALLLP
ncbi:ATP-binding cassette domain-containing protein [Vibrio sp. D404a]|uniref:ATP-binding cassette domain-containing protein n=1 Tax=unclassified Vibrio TaxID=2614977 RepID=UPI002553006C|nr:ATP-binding cassette domain-containing protein [Vibrio sp. D404a]MDK9797205.1 ATP-binding cassette domain-containing protein [Vibrio sp. D449a]